MNKLYLLIIFINVSTIINKASTVNQIKVETYQLSNGFTVMLCEDHTQPKVFGTVVCKAGSKNDPPDATGMAHYQEHMLFKGTTQLGTTNWEFEKFHIDSIVKLYDILGITKSQQQRDSIQILINNQSLKAAKYAIPNELSNLIKSAGGTDMNAATGPDITVFNNTFPPAQIERWLNLYGHRFRQPVFRSFQSELEVVYEEKNMYADNFFTGIYEKFLYNFFKNHPYGQQTTIGTIDDLKNPSLSKMYTFYKNWYVANNMGLILVGNFSSQMVKPIIEKEFGQWNQGKLSDKKVFAEQAFKGREFIEIAASPIPIGLLGFRTVARNHPDEIALDVLNGMLMNRNRTGLFDMLVLSGQLMAAELIPIIYNEHGGVVLLTVPKSDGQTIAQAEEIILNEIEKIKKGFFDENLLNAIKLERYRDFQLSLESLRSISDNIAQAFGSGKNPNNCFKYTDEVKAISRDKIIEVANKYYGTNYLAFYSQTGNTVKEKIDKPNFKPIVVNTNVKSGYAKQFDSIKIQQIQPKLINFTTDVLQYNINNFVKVYKTENPLNDIFTLNLKIGVGVIKDSLMNYIAEYLNYCGVDTFSAEVFKNKLSELGCNYSVEANNSFIEISLEGPEDNLSKALFYLNLLITKPCTEADKINIIAENARVGRKIEHNDPDNVGDALLEYVRFNNKSRYIRRLGIAEIEQLQPDTLIEHFKFACKVGWEIHYCGLFDTATLRKVITSNLNTNTCNIKSEVPYTRQTINYSKPQVFLCNKGDALQSKIYFYFNGVAYNKANDVPREAFNLYFGGDFSGLVLQEIREYRSMAYSAGAEYTLAQKEGENCNFIGFIGTQADKTNAAIETFAELLYNMPQKPERVAMISDYLQQSATSDYPTFRELSNEMVKLMWRGYKTDPLIEKLPLYKNLKYEQIQQFYNSFIKNQPVSILIVGDTKRIDIKKLEKFGTIVNVEESELFRD